MSVCEGGEGFVVGGRAGGASERVWERGTEGGSEERKEGGGEVDGCSASTTDLLAGRCCACDDKHCAIILSFRFTLGSFYQTSSSRSNKKFTKIDVRRSCFPFVACSQLALPSFCCAQKYNPSLKG